MSKGYDTREFIMPEGTEANGENALIRGMFKGMPFKRDEYIAHKRTLIRGRPGYLSKGGEPYDELEAGKSFATDLKSGVIRELI